MTRPASGVLFAPCGCSFVKVGHGLCDLYTLDDAGEFVARSEKAALASDPPVWSDVLRASLNDAGLRRLVAIESLGRVNRETALIAYALWAAEALRKFRED